MVKLLQHILFFTRNSPHALFFTENCHCIAWIKCCWQCTKPQPCIFYPKLSDLVLLVMPNACDTPIQCYLWFVQGAAFAIRERNETSFCTNNNAQLQPAAGLGQLATTNWAQPDELRTTRDSRLVS